MEPELAAGLASRALARLAPWPKRFGGGAAHGVQVRSPHGRIALDDVVKTPSVDAQSKNILDSSLACGFQYPVDSSLALFISKGTHDVNAIRVRGKEPKHVELVKTRLPTQFETFDNAFFGRVVQDLAWPIFSRESFISHVDRLIDASSVLRH